MRSSSVQTIALSPHSETRSDAVRRISVQVTKTPDRILAVTYAIDGDLDRLRVPAVRPPRVVDKLWQHTCCEIFIARKGAAEYHEFNLAPSGEWDAYAFARYRERAPSNGTVDSLNPKIAVRATAKKLELDALIPLDRLSPLHADSALLLALAVVIEDQDGLLYYWALKHPTGKPDFHHADAFALELE
ncbi:MAG: DOMON-like domain-containing protein [Gammaproteobacteria bacterium]|nr:DOMON-like domain-containing protein [Gammaproteobacteria bacterium]